MDYFLSGIPAPILCESLISWIQRVCQIYDLTFSRFHSTFGTKNCIDLDLCMTSDDVDRIAEICQLPRSTFLVLQNSFCRFAERPELHRLLLFQSNRRPLYRFCTECLATDKIPFLRLEWRFKVWEHCPYHHTPLRIGCPSCNKPLAMHRSILGGTITPAPVHNLAYCLHCRVDMRRPHFRNPSWPLVEPELSPAIAYQKAIVSAILHDHFCIAPFEEKLPLETLFTLMDGVGLESADNRSNRIFEKMGATDLDTLFWVMEETCHGAKWLKRGHPKRRSLARSAFQIWKSQQ